MKSISTKLILTSLAISCIISSTLHAQNRQQPNKPFSTGLEQKAEQFLLLSGEVLAALQIQKLTYEEKELLNEIKTNLDAIERIKKYPTDLDQVLEWQDINTVKYIWKDKDGYVKGGINGSLLDGHTPVGLDNEGFAGVTKKKLVTYGMYKEHLINEHQNRAAYYTQKLAYKNPKFRALKFVKYAGSLTLAIDIGSRLHTIFVQKTYPGAIAIDDFVKTLENN